MKNPTHISPVLVFYLSALLLLLQTGCMSSPVATSSTNLATSQLPLLGLGAAGGAILGQGLDDNIGAPVGAGLALAGTAAYLKYSNERQARIVAEAKEEARREERAKLMQDYWVEAAGMDSVGSWNGRERDIRYDAGVYDGVSYGTRSLPRELYFQEPPR